MKTSNINMIRCPMRKEINIFTYVASLDTNTTQNKSGEKFQHLHDSKIIDATIVLSSTGECAHLKVKYIMCHGTR